MGELQKHQVEITPVKQEQMVVLPSDIPLQRMQKEIYLSTRNYPKIKNIKGRKVVVQTIHVLINKTILDKGVNMPPEEISYLKTRVTDDIINDYGGYSLEEIRLAFHYGVRGEFGEYFGLNPTTFYGWLRDFRYKMLPPINQKVQQLLPKPEPIVPSKQENEEGIRNTIYDVYFKLCTEGIYEFYDIGNVCYKYLDKLGLIPYTNEQKMEFMVESRNHFRQSVVRRNSEFQKKGKEFHKIDVDRAFKMIEEQYNPRFEYQIRIGAMRLALHHFFKGCAEEDIDLKELIDRTINEKKD